jgi:hypothetical protein
MLEDAPVYDLWSNGRCNCSSTIAYSNYSAFACHNHQFHSVGVLAKLKLWAVFIHTEFYTRYVYVLTIVVRTNYQLSIFFVSVDNNILTRYQIGFMLQKH